MTDSLLRTVCRLSRLDHHKPRGRDSERERGKRNIEGVVRETNGGWRGERERERERAREREREN